MADGDDKKKGTSKGLLYDNLHAVLKPAVDKEWTALDGHSEKKWFTELMGAKTYDELYTMFTPGPHQDAWSGIDWHEGSAFDDKSLHARAIAYMDSWRRDLNILYGEDEINSIAFQQNGVGKWLAQSDEIDEFLKE